jgi:hypothetical protein
MGGCEEARERRDMRAWEAEGKSAVGKGPGTPAKGSTQVSHQTLYSTVLYSTVLYCSTSYEEVSNEDEPTEPQHTIMLRRSCICQRPAFAAVCDTSHVEKPFAQGPTKTSRLTPK